MKTLTPEPVDPTFHSMKKPSRGRTTDSFFILAGVLCLILVLTGFSLTYIKPVFAGTFTGSIPVHFHGVVFFAWLLLFIAQPLLIQKRKLSMHRKIGSFGFALAVIMLIMGVYVALVSAREGRAGGSPFPAYHFLIIPLTDMLLFGGFILVALLNLKKSETHKRLMLLATVAILPAAFGRLFSYMDITHPAIMLLMTESIVLLGMAVDFVRTKSVHKVYLWGGGIMLFVHFIRIPLGGTEIWRSVAETLIKLV